MVEGVTGVAETGAVEGGVEAVVEVEAVFVGWLVPFVSVCT